MKPMSRPPRGPEGGPDSLAKSHSVKSNLTLTLICILAAIGFFGIFASLGFMDLLSKPIFGACLAVSAVLAVGCGFLLKQFRR